MFKEANLPLFTCFKTKNSQEKNPKVNVKLYIKLVTRPAEDEPVAVVADVDLEQTLSASSSSSSEFGALFLALLSAPSFLRLPRGRRRLPLPLLADSAAGVVLPVPLLFPQPLLSSSSSSVLLLVAPPPPPSSSEGFSETAADDANSSSSSDPETPSSSPELKLRSGH